MNKGNSLVNRSSAGSPCELLKNVNPKVQSRPNTMGSVISIPSLTIKFLRVVDSQ
jgi:hypothetical protein